MANLKDHKSSELTKMLLIGDSGTGKTGALAALANKGMKLRILDFDNGLDSLVSALGGPSGKNISNVEYVSLRDGYKAGPVGPILDGMPNTFVNAMRMLTDWDPSKLSGVPADIKTGNKLGSPATWGKDYCLVIDSLTFLGDAAYDQCLAMNPSAKDLRQIYGAAQDGLSNVLSLITSGSFNTNLVVISHVRYVERPDGTTKGYPSAIGGALSLKIATYFNSVALCESSGTPPKRTIRTAATALVDLKNPASFRMLAALPLETGLADFFATVQA